MSKNKVFPFDEGRIYKSVNSDIGLAIIKYIGQKIIVYEYFCDWDDLVEMKSGDEMSKDKYQFSSSFKETDFVHSPIKE